MLRKAAAWRTFQSCSAGIISGSVCIAGTVKLGVDVVDLGRAASSGARSGAADVVRVLEQLQDVIDQVGSAITEILRDRHVQFGPLQPGQSPLADPLDRAERADRDWID